MQRRPLPFFFPVIKQYFSFATALHIKQFQVGWQRWGRGELLASMLPWQGTVFNAKHGSYKSTAICDMPPSGPIKMQPLFKIHPVLIQLGWNPERLAAALPHFSLWDVFKEPLLSFFLFLQLGCCFSVFKLNDFDEDDRLICVCEAWM